MGNSIITAVDVNDKIIIIDVEKLKDYDRVKNARVFKTLFKINEQSEFGDYPMKVNDDGHVTILQDLDISNTDWYNLIQFLENGLVKIDHLNKDQCIELIENINITNMKLGGFPSFDDYYKDFYSNQIESREIYNPFTPEEDHKQIYIWDLELDTNHNFRHTHKITDGWSATKHYRLGSSVTDFIWWRKLKS